MSEIIVFFSFPLVLKIHYFYIIFTHIHSTKLVLNWRAILIFNGAILFYNHLSLCVLENTLVLSAVCSSAMRVLFWPKKGSFKISRVIVSSELCKLAAKQREKFLNREATRNFLSLCSYVFFKTANYANILVLLSLCLF